MNNKKYQEIEYWCLICGADLNTNHPDICHDCKESSQRICQINTHPVYWNEEHRTLACPTLWVSACPEGDNKLTPYFGRLYTEASADEQKIIDRALAKVGLSLNYVHNEMYVVSNLTSRIKG